MGGFGFTLLATLVVIGVLVFVHELGHFIAAKLARIYVHRFSLGLGGPIRWLSFRRGETEYSVSWLPLGGYVKMASSQEDPVSSTLEGGAGTATVPADRVFEARPVWVRMGVILAGVVMNVLFAWVVFTGLVYTRGLPVLVLTPVAGVDTAGLPPQAARTLGRVLPGDRIVAVEGGAVDSWQDVERLWLSAPGDTVTVEFAGVGRLDLLLPRGGDERRRALRGLRPELRPVIADVVPGRPGAAAGLAVGDTILALDGAAVAQWVDLVDLIASRPEQEIRLLIGRAGGRTDVRVTPAAETVTDSAGTRTVGRLGIYGPQLPERRDPAGIVTAVLEGARRTAFVSTQIVAVVRGMFSGRVSTRELGGPIAIGMAAGQSARLGGEEFLSFMAAISVNLAVLNLLPIPILDGGQFLFLLAEAVTRRPVTGRIREWLSLAGMVMIVLLMLLAFSNDIRRLLGI
jgi:regulator of sigma E protease